MCPNSEKLLSKYPTCSSEDVQGLVTKSPCTIISHPSATVQGPSCKQECVLDQPAYLKKSRSWVWEAPALWLQKLSPGTRQLLRNLSLRFHHLGPGSKLSCFKGFIPPPPPPLWKRRLLSGSTGTSRVGFAAITVADWSNTHSAGGFDSLTVESCDNNTSKT